LTEEKIMSQFVLNEAEDNGFQAGFINEVTFLYVSLQDAREKYKSTELEYSVKCVVDKATAKAFKKAYPKNGVKEVDTSEFKETFGIDAPYPDQDEQFILTMKTNAQDKDGQLLSHNAFKRPKVYVPSGRGVKDITAESLVANGSKGDVNFWVSDTEFGQFPKLTAILVRELIVYEKRENAGSAWGSVENAEAQPQNGFEKQEKELAPELLEEDDNFA